MVKQHRSIWGSKIGFLLAAIGSAIGLGNIWRFSYMAYEYGGGAFLIPYFVALVVAGIPLMILEYAVGHMEQASSPLAFARVSRGWEWIGWWMPTVALFGIMLYYSVIIGWCVNYFFYSINLSWAFHPEGAQGFFFKEYLQLSDSPFHLGGIRVPILSATFFVWFSCWAICYREINHGIEKASMIFMPLLLVLTLILVIWTLTLDGAVPAVLNYYLKPDFIQLKKAEVWIAAFGQIFFSLSLGFGIMITYASYLPKKTNIVESALWTAVIDCVYSFIAGFAVFGIVGFMACSKNLPYGEVVKGGPQLAFVVYPEAITQLPFANSIFGMIFFLVLIMAGLSSGISLVEAFTCSLIDKFDWKRRNVVTLTCLLGFLGSVIFTTKAGLHILDIADHFITNYGLVVGGLLECLLVGWLIKARTAREHVNKCSEKIKLSFLWDICIRYITPVIILLILIQAFLKDLKKAYGGYDIDALILFGADWIMLTIVIAVVFTFYPWTPDKLKRHHRPDDEKLLT